MGALALDAADPVRIRAFFGLPLPDAQREQLDRHLAACVAAAPQFRWTPAANLHLTVRFLGQVDAEVAERVAAGVDDLALDAFDIRLGGVGTFKRGRLARVVWMGLAGGAEPLAQLAIAVEAECVREGLEPEARRFNAHLTLARARARDGSPLPDLPEPPAMDGWRAEELILYRSHLGRAGSVYEPVTTIRLR